MTIRKTPPYPADQMLDRYQIKALAKCTQSEIIYISKYRPNKFPDWCHRGTNRKLFYRKSEIIKWLSKNNIKQIFKGKSLTHYALKQSERPIFDSEAAVKFIIAKPVDYVPVKAKYRARPRTTVVHLDEIDLYTPMPYVDPWRSTGEVIVHG